MKITVSKSKPMTRTIIGKAINSKNKTSNSIGSLYTAVQQGASQQD